MNFLKVLTIFLQFSSSSSKLRYTLDEKFENCSNSTDHYLDLGELKFTMINETLTVADGKMVVTKEVKSPWKAGFIGERYDRGQWILMFQKKMNDFCQHILNPLEV